MSDEEEISGGEEGAGELQNDDVWSFTATSQCGIMLCIFMQAVEDNPLSKEMAGECLSLLSRTGDGLAHAYVRMDVKDK